MQSGTAAKPGFGPFLALGAAPGGLGGKCASSDRELPSAFAAEPGNVGRAHHLLPWSRTVLEDDIAYYSERAEDELEQVQRARKSEALHAHFMLALAYLERVDSAKAKRDAKHA